MMAFLWWALVSALGVGIGFYVIGFPGAVYMALVGALAGGLVWFEEKSHQD